MLILASSTPIPMPGWNRDSLWGTFLSSEPGLALSALSAALGLATIWVTPGRKAAAPLISMAFPIAALVALSPPKISLDEGVLNSFLRMDAVEATSRENLDNAAIEAFLSQVRAGENPQERTQAVEERIGRMRPWDPETYAIRTAVALWRETQAPLAMERMTKPPQAVDDLGSLRASLSSLIDQRTRRSSKRILAVHSYLRIRR